MFMFSIQKSCWTLFFVQLFYLNFLQAQFREWTNNQGQKIQAELISVQSGKAQFKLSNGLDTLYPIINLCQSDQEFIQLFSNSEQPTQSSSTHKTTLDWDKLWPKEAQLDLSSHTAEFIRESEGIYTYETANFTFLSDVKLATTAIRNFSRIFEATHTYASAIPFFHDIHNSSSRKIPIEVYNFKRDYIKNGGIEGSAGVCFVRKDNTHIKVCFDYLGVKRIGSKISFDYSGDSTTIPHEIVHALTDIAYYDNDMKWFTEGIAEYMSNTEYSLGQTKYKLISIERYIKSATTTRGNKKYRGRNLGNNITMPKLHSFMTQPNFFDSGNPKKN